MISEADFLRLCVYALPMDLCLYFFLLSSFSDSLLFLISYQLRSPVFYNNILLRHLSNQIFSIMTVHSIVMHTVRLIFTIQISQYSIIERLRDVLILEVFEEHAGFIYHLSTSAISLLFIALHS